MSRFKISGRNAFNMKVTNHTSKVNQAISWIRKHKLGSFWISCNVQGMRSIIIKKDKFSHKYQFGYVVGHSSSKWGLNIMSKVERKK